MKTKTARVIYERVTEREIHEVEIRHDDEPGQVIEITRSLRGLTRRGPQRTIDVTPSAAVAK